MVAVDVNELVRELMGLPAAIAEAERAVVMAALDLARLKHTLEAAKARLLLSGAIDGKNSEQREAQLRLHPEIYDLTEQMIRAEQTLAECKRVWNLQCNRLQALQAVVGLVAGKRGEIG